MATPGSYSMGVYGHFYPPCPWLIPWGASGVWVPPPTATRILKLLPFRQSLQRGPKSNLWSPSVHLSLQITVSDSSHWVSTYFVLGSVVFPGIFSTSHE